jgi:membrane-associated HD superfamily phosphohydrolase
MSMMTVGAIVKSICFGLLFAILAIGLLPFLVAFSLADISELTEYYEWGGTPSLFLLPRLKKHDKKE